MSGVRVLVLTGPLVATVLVATVLVATVLVATVSIPHLGCGINCIGGEYGLISMARVAAFLL